MSNWHERNLLDREIDIKIVTSSLAGEHVFSFGQIDWRVANSSSYNEHPSTHEFRMQEQSAFNQSLLPNEVVEASDLILAGGHGNISVTANVIPEEMARLVDSALAGDVEHCNRLNQEISGLNKALFQEANPIPIKWALAEMGIIPPGIRLPLTLSLIHI